MLTRLGSHNLDFNVDPWRSSCSFPFIGFVELGSSDRSLHETCSFGKPRVKPPAFDCAVASYDGSCSESHKNTKEKTAGGSRFVIE